MFRFLLLVLTLSLGSCAILPGGKPVSGRSIYLLESRLPVVANEQPGCQIIVINPPEIAPGHAGSRMLYQRKPNLIEHFAFSVWAASPAVMIEPLLVEALRDSGRYEGVLSAPAPVPGDLRVENDQLWLIQKFDDDSSYVELSMASRVFAPKRRRLLDSRRFSYAVPTSAATPEAGVDAAKIAVQKLLADFRQFIGDAADSTDQACANQ